MVYRPVSPEWHAVVRRSRDIQEQVGDECTLFRQPWQQAGRYGKACEKRGHRIVSGECTHRMPVRRTIVNEFAMRTNKIPSDIQTAFCRSTVEESTVIQTYRANRSSYSRQVPVSC